MNKEVLALPSSDIQRAVKEFPTPFFIYSEEKLRENCRKFKNAFTRHFPDFEPLFAIKANPNPSLVKIIFEEGFAADASSEAEAWLTQRLNGTGMYTGNYTTEDEFKFVLDTGVFQLNLDDISMLPVVKRLGMPEFISFRVNPGIGQGGMSSLILAGPDAKYGVPADDLLRAYSEAKALGVKRFGLHTMTGSNVLDEDYFAAVTERLLTLAEQLWRKLDIRLEKINLGGGFGVPYQPSQKSLDLEKIVLGVRKVFDQFCAQGLPEPVLMAEPGRYIAADAGWLVGKVHVIKEGAKKFIGIDAGMNDLPRPAIYDAYHHITVLPQKQTDSQAVEKVNVVGRLCENNDQFAKDRLLPPVSAGDYIVIHNAGAHAYAMGHNYNNRLRSAEYLITRGGSFKLIRRAETIADIFKTTDI